MSFVYAVRAILRNYSKPVKDVPYLIFVRHFPCVGCGSSRRIEAAHIGPRGLKQKTSDCTALPLCFDCHQGGNKSLHKIGSELFEIQRGLVFADLQSMFNHWFFLKHGRYAAGWVEEEERRKAA